MAELDNDFQDLMEDRYAQETWRSYSSATNLFSKFAKRFKLSKSIYDYGSETDQPVWVAFVLYAKRKRKVLRDTVRKYLSAYRSMAANIGVNLDFPRMPVLRAVMKAWKRQDVGKPLKVPVTAADLKALHAKASALGRNYVAMAHFCYYTLARVKEAAAVTWDDVTEYKERVTFRLKRTKTDPFGEETTVLSMSSESWKQVKDILRSQNRQNKGSIFNVPKAEAFRSWIKKCLSEGGKKTGHSLRRGGAQALFDAGHEIEMIRIKGRWRSRAFERYIDFSSRHISI